MFRTKGEEMKAGKLFVSCICVCSLLMGSLPLTYAVNTPPQAKKQG